MFGLSKDATRTPTQGGVPITSNWEEATGKTKDSVETLYLFTGLGTAEEVAQERVGWSSLLELLACDPTISG